MILSLYFLEEVNKAFFKQNFVEVHYIKHITAELLEVKSLALLPHMYPQVYLENSKGNKEPCLKNTGLVMML